ncbi:MAG: hypothetical protein ACLFPR_15310 [Desulfococcaceae bacterium]
MNVLKVISEGPHDLKTVVSGALEKEARLLEAGIRKTEKRLSAFEEKYQKKTDDFLADYAEDRLDDSMDFMEWVGEHRMLERLREKMKALRKQTEKHDDLEP